MNRDEYREAVASVLFSDDTCSDPECESCQEMVDRLADLMITVRPIRQV